MNFLKRQRWAHSANRVLRGQESRPEFTLRQTRMRAARGHSSATADDLVLAAAVASDASMHLRRIGLGRKAAQQI